MEQIFQIIGTSISIFLIIGFCIFEYYRIIKYNTLHTRGFIFYFCLAFACVLWLITSESFLKEFIKNSITSFLILQLFEGIYVLNYIGSLFIFTISLIRMLFSEHFFDLPKELRKPKILKQFKINKFLMLQLEDYGSIKRTVIYVKKERFDQCKYLLLEIPLDKIEDLEEINSIDEAIEKLDHSHEQHLIEIPFEEEFWVHCSNLQAWYENKYDLRLLHKNLGLPLLKRLADAGEPLALIRFKEEIAYRIEKGDFKSILCLEGKGDLKYFTDEELDALEFVSPDFRLIRQHNISKSFEKIAPWEFSFKRVPDSKRFIFSQYVFKGLREKMKKTLKELENNED